MTNKPKSKKFELTVFSPMTNKYQPHGQAPLFNKSDDAMEYARKNIKYGSKWRIRPCYGREAPERLEWKLIPAILQLKKKG